MEKREFTVKIIDLEPYRNLTVERLSRRMLTEIAEYANESRFLYPGPGGYLSASTISAFQRCPREVLYAKFEKLKPFRPSMTMIGGNATHKGLETIYKKLRVDPCAMINRDEILSAANDDFMQRLDKEDLKDREELTLDEFVKKADGLKDDIMRTLSAYIEFGEYLNVGKVVGSEQEFMFTINGIPIYGFADLLTESAVIDFKFSQKNNTAMRQKSVPSDMQIFLYQLRFNKPGELHILVPPAKKATKTERELVNIIKYEDYPTWPASAFVDAIEDICTCIETGNFPRRGLSYDGCTECLFADTCLKRSSFVKIDYDDSSTVQADIDDKIHSAAEFKEVHIKEIQAEEERTRVKEVAATVEVQQIDDLFDTKGATVVQTPEQVKQDIDSVRDEQLSRPKRLLKRGGSHGKASDLSVD
jgi:hypothetical protein